MEMWKKASLRSTDMNHVPLLTLERSERVVNILKQNFFRHLLLLWLGEFESLP